MRILAIAILLAPVAAFVAYLYVAAHQDAGRWGVAVLSLGITYVASVVWALAFLAGI